MDKVEESKVSSSSSRAEGGESDSDSEPGFYDPLADATVSRHSFPLGDGGGAADGDGSTVTIELRASAKLDPTDAFALLDGDDYTGQLLWDGSVLLSKYLAEHGDELRAGSTAMGRSRAVVELGAGAGLAAAVAGALELGEPVIPTDGADRALELCSRNLAEFGWRGVAAPVCFNWSSELPDELAAVAPVHLVVAADAAYDLAAIRPLFAAVGALAPAIFVYAHYPRALTAAQQAAIDEAIPLAAADVGYEGGVVYSSDDGGSVMVWRPVATMLEAMQRLRREGRLIDAEVVAMPSGEAIPAHAVVLATSLPVAEALFDLQHEVERVGDTGVRNRLELDGPPEAIALLVDAIYAGSAFPPHVLPEAAVTGTAPGGGGAVLAAARAAACGGADDVAAALAQAFADLALGELSSDGDRAVLCLAQELVDAPNAALAHIPAARALLPRLLSDAAYRFGDLAADELAACPLPLLRLLFAHDGLRVGSEAEVLAAVRGVVAALASDEADTATAAATLLPTLRTALLPADALTAEEVAVLAGCGGGSSVERPRHHAVRSSAAGAARALVAGGDGPSGGELSVGKIFSGVSDDGLASKAIPLVMAADGGLVYLGLYDGGVVAVSLAGDGRMGRVVPVVSVPSPRRVTALCTLASDVVVAATARSLTGRFKSRGSSGGQSSGVTAIARVAHFDGTEEFTPLAADGFPADVHHLVAVHKEHILVGVGPDPQTIFAAHAVSRDGGRRVTAMAACGVCVPVAGLAVCSEEVVAAAVGAQVVFLGIPREPSSAELTVMAVCDLPRETPAISAIGRLGRPQSELAVVVGCLDGSLWIVRAEPERAPELVAGAGGRISRIACSEADDGFLAATYTGELAAYTTSSEDNALEGARMCEAAIADVVLVGETLVILQGVGNDCALLTLTPHCS
ncbi:uncharacterized protein AMSG_12321 [Thecamonas trahens ATCC 50062]|uniref:BTB domain-containing protein n=1 Tax=Thecamonas trahens ATCC 50062 TaxID=461836 RepID=A0A0L0DPZ7_THETB|nr:hypothetical protein AMSG_12321 [Thecamonas trahens ATCC 50062]KNC54377.1 hypothetical protein AMSG_12321 [Thecamonas trahens ATCC 50062]|eukprot:XP_013753738.1 hypothetical protein AMSG_12321 [Thecamonas trahens ATCC 50062]